VFELREEKKALVTRQASLEGEIQALNKQLVSLHAKVKSSAEIAGGVLTQPVIEKVVKPEQQTEGVPGTQIRGSHDSDSSSSSSDVHTSNSNQSGHPLIRQGRKCDPHPPGYRSLTGRIEKFSGK